MSGLATRGRCGNSEHEEARGHGANAVVSMRFDTSEMGETWTEVCAYGTAVLIEPLAS